MKTSAPRSLFTQQQFWDEPLGNHGHVRTALGSFAEELTAKLFGGRRHKTDSTCEYCPDVVARGIYFECKAAGKSNQTFIYSGRLEKDRQFAADNWLGYAIWWHAVNTSQATTVGELRSLFLYRLRGLFVVPFEAIETLCDARKPEQLNSAYGKHGAPGCYGSGYRINVSELRPWLYASWECEPIEKRLAATCGEC